MIWGVISDSHDNLPLLRKALEEFRREGVEKIIHAGDFVSPFTARLFEGWEGKLIGVFGNNDGEKRGLRKAYQKIGEIYEDFFLGEIEGFRLYLTHRGELVEYLARGGEIDFLIYGHTHSPEIKKIGNSLILNPGESSGWLTGSPSVALLFPEERKAEIIHLR